MKTQEFEIVQALSSVDLPEPLIHDGNIKELIRAMASDQKAVAFDAKRLEQVRQEQKEGNFVGNWLKDRDDKVQDAQIELNKSIGRLTQTSSQLLIVNTAISKVLNDQQNVLLAQQHTLKQQTDTLEEQNRKILEQQKLLEEQQKQINEANQGLMEAKGVTQEQARELVGCVVRVTEAEKRIDVSGETLRAALEQQMNASVAECIAGLNEGFTQQELRHHALERQFDSAFALQARDTKAELERFARAATEWRNDIEQQLQGDIKAVMEQTSAQEATVQKLNDALAAQLNTVRKDLNETLEQKELSLHAAQRKSAVRNRLSQVAVAGLAVASLFWQIAQHFALMP